MKEKGKSIQSLEDEWRAAHGGRAFFSHQTDLIEASGEDRHRFLNGFVTNDLGSLAPPRWSYGFCATVKGRILADFHALALDDRLVLEVPAGQGQGLVDHLLKYRIADRVDLQSRAATTLSLLGEEPEGVESLGLARVPAAGEGFVISSTLGEVLALRRSVAGLPALAFLVTDDSFPSFRDHLLGSGFTELSPQTWDCLHIAAGQLRFGTDFGEDHFPQETGLDDQAVSYTKGCYLGQEVIARIHYRGGVNRFPRGLRFSAPSVKSGMELELDGRAVGKVGAVANSPRFGSFGLAILHRRAAELDTSLDLPGGGKAQVCELPFALD